MCVYSMIMDKAIGWPEDYWHQPAVPKIFDNLLKGAKEYDKRTNQPDCELEEKKALLKKLADQLGININFGD